MNLTYPLSTKCFNILCVLDGTASLKLISIVGFTPFFSSVQTPFGPRKSGIPHGVEIPAPVWMTMCFDLRNRSTSFSTFSAISDGESKIWKNYRNCVLKFIMMDIKCILNIGLNLRSNLDINDELAWKLAMMRLM